LIIEILVFFRKQSFLFSLNELVGLSSFLLRKSILLVPEREKVLLRLVSLNLLLPLEGHTFSSVEYMHVVNCVHFNAVLVVVSFVQSIVHTFKVTLSDLPPVLHKLDCGFVRKIC